MGVVAVGPTVTLGAGAAMASAAMNMVMVLSFGLFSWLGHFDEEEAEEMEAQEVHRPPPAPEYLSDSNFSGTINIACIGPPGCGKSSLVNALRRTPPRHRHAAPAGLGQTTEEPVVYQFHDRGAWMNRRSDEDAPDSSDDILREWAQGCVNVEQAQEDSCYTVREARRDTSGATICLWDMPAMEDTVREAYCRDLGLAHFDAVLIVYSERLSASELNVVKDLDKCYKVPCLLVRTHVDVDVANEAADHGVDAEEALARLRREALGQGASSVFLVSSREPEKHDMFNLRAVISTLAKARQRAACETECPVCFHSFDGEGLMRSPCHWCGNAVCLRCARRLGQGLGEAPCPFCRRWTPHEP